MAQTNLRTFKQFSEQNPAFSEASLRWLRFNSQSRPSSNGAIPGNGFKKAFTTIGRRVLIDEDRFFECIRENS